MRSSSDFRPGCRPVITCASVAGDIVRPETSFAVQRRQFAQHGALLPVVDKNLIGLQNCFRFAIPRRPPVDTSNEPGLHQAAWTSDASALVIVKITSASWQAASILAAGSIPATPVSDKRSTQRLAALERAGRHADV